MGPDKFRLTGAGRLAAATRLDAAANAARENIFFLNTRQHATGRAEMDRTGRLRYGGSALATNYWRGRSGHTQRAMGGTNVKIGRPDGKVKDNSRETANVGAGSARVGATGSRASCAADPPTKRCREVSGRPTTGNSSFR